MATQTRCDIFWMEPAEGTLDELETALSQAAVANYGQHVNYTYAGQLYCFEDLEWDADARRFYGVMYKKRLTKFPSEIADNSSSPIPIRTGNSLGFPVCYVFDPSLRAIAVQYEHAGARASAIASGFASMGLPPLVMTPVISSNISQRLREARIIRGFEFKLKRPADGSEALARNLGLGANEAMNLFETSGAQTVRIEISMGHTRGDRGLQGRVKRMARALLSNESVGQLQIKGRASAEDEIDVIDLLNDRVHGYFEFELDRNRRVDTAIALRILDAWLSDSEDMLGAHPDRSEWEEQDE